MPVRRSNHTNLCPCARTHIPAPPSNYNKTPSQTPFLPINQCLVLLGSITYYVLPRKPYVRNNLSYPLSIFVASSVLPSKQILELEVWLISVDDNNMGEGNFIFRVVFKLWNKEGMIELENHHIATLNEWMGLVIDLLTIQKDRLFAFWWQTQTPLKIIFKKINLNLIVLRSSTIYMKYGTD